MPKPNQKRTSLTSHLLESQLLHHLLPSISHSTSISTHVLLTNLLRLHTVNSISSSSSSSASASDKGRRSSKKSITNACISCITLHLINIDTSTDINWCNDKGLIDGLISCFCCFFDDLKMRKREEEWNLDDDEHEDFEDLRMSNELNFNCKMVYKGLLSISDATHNNPPLKSKTKTNMAPNVNPNLQFISMMAITTLSSIMNQTQAQAQTTHKSNKPSPSLYISNVGRKHFIKNGGLSLLLLLSYYNLDHDGNGNANVNGNDNVLSFVKQFDHDNVTRLINHRSIREKNFDDTLVLDQHKHQHKHQHQHKHKSSTYNSLINPDGKLYELVHVPLMLIKEYYSPTLVLPLFDSVKQMTVKSKSKSKSKSKQDDNSFIMIDIKQRLNQAKTLANNETNIRSLKSLTISNEIDKRNARGVRDELERLRNSWKNENRVFVRQLRATSKDGESGSGADLCLCDVEREEEAEDLVIMVEDEKNLSKHSYSLIGIGIGNGNGNGNSSNRSKNKKKKENKNKKEKKNNKEEEKESEQNRRSRLHTLHLKQMTANRQKMEDLEILEVSKALDFKAQALKVGKECLRIKAEKSREDREYVMSRLKEFRRCDKIEEKDRVGKVDRRKDEFDKVLLTVRSKDESERSVSVRDRLNRERKEEERIGAWRKEEEVIKSNVRTKAENEMLRIEKRKQERSNALAKIKKDKEVNDSNKRAAFAAMTKIAQVRLLNSTFTTNSRDGVMKFQDRSDWRKERIKVTNVVNGLLCNIHIDIDIEIDVDDGDGDGNGDSSKSGGGGGGGKNRLSDVDREQIIVDKERSVMRKGGKLKNFYRGGNNNKIISSDSSSVDRVKPVSTDPWIEQETADGKTVLFNTVTNEYKR